MNNIGRNDLCFCGSNKKYKNCCINMKYKPGLGLEVFNLDERDTARIKAAYDTFYTIGIELKCLSMIIDVNIETINNVQYFIIMVTDKNFEVLGLQNKGRVMCLKPLNCSSKELAEYVSIQDTGELLIKNMKLDFLDLMTILPDSFCKKYGAEKREYKAITPLVFTESKKGKKR